MDLEFFLKNLKLLSHLTFFGLTQCIKHELKDHLSSQPGISLILKVSIPALLNGTHPLQVDTGQLIEMVCSVHSVQLNWEDNKTDSN